MDPEILGGTVAVEVRELGAIAADTNASRDDAVRESAELCHVRGVASMDVLSVAVTIQVSEVYTVNQRIRKGVHARIDQSSQVRLR